MHMNVKHIPIMLLCLLIWYATILYFKLFGEVKLLLVERIKGKVQKQLY